MVTPSPGRRTLVGALVLALLAVAVAPGLGGAAPVDSGAGNAGSGSGLPGAGADLGLTDRTDRTDRLFAQQETPTNGTVRHEDPDEVNRQGDLASVERYLSARLSERLAEGSVSISQGEYRAARSVLGDEYDAELARYVEVAGETEGTADDEAAESFSRAGEQSETFANQSAEFEDTYEAYQRAHERGEEARARELARELVEQARAVNRTDRRLRGNLQTIESNTGRDLSTARARVRNVSASVQERADEVAAATFVRTEIEASADPTDVSFLRPTTVSGRLVDENGTALSGATVQVGTGTDAVRTETDESGAFAATYRPVRLPADAEAVTVRHVPANDSVYLGARTNASVSVTPVTPTVTAETASATAAFGDRVRVSGTVSAEDVPVAGLPVVASVDGVQIARGVTDDEGAYAIQGTLPADVAAGDRQVEVRVDQRGRAVERASASAPLSVEPTATTLSLSGSAGEERTVSVSGRLSTADGTGLEGRTVRLFVDGRLVETARTDGGGAYSATFAPAADLVGDDGTVRVAARFDGDGTSLEGASAETAVSVPSASSGTDPLGISPSRWLALAAGGLLAAGALVVWRRRTPGEGTGGERGDGVAASGATGGSGADDGGAAAPVESSWREDVTALLEAGETDLAVARAYGAARARLRAEVEATGALTHWEFYAAARGDGVGAGRVEALLALTEAYERARFAPASVSAEDAEAAVDSAADAMAG